MTSITIPGIGLTLFLCFIFSELAGYLLHIVLHSNRIRWLSNSHMIHHMKLYGPKMTQIRKEYRVSVSERFSVAGIGLEWLIPGTGILAATLLTGYILNIHYAYLAIFFVFAVLYGYFLFAYMHKAMHLKDFWMIRNSWLKNWFFKIRRLHNIHHMELDGKGRMNTNYGICFYFFDFIFRTKQSTLRKFNEKGYNAARRRYAYILDE